MGRYIDCQVGNEHKIVWKYWFGSQASEMGRIHEESGIGTYQLLAYDENLDGEVFLDPEKIPKDRPPPEHIDLVGDVLTLRQADVPALSSLLETLRGEDPEGAYTLMVEAIRDFVRDHPEQDELVLEGEF